MTDGSIDRVSLLQDGNAAFLLPPLLREESSASNSNRLSEEIRLTLIFSPHLLGCGGDSFPLFPSFFGFKNGGGLNVID